MAPSASRIVLLAAIALLALAGTLSGCAATTGTETPHGTAATTTPNPTPTLTTAPTTHASPSEPTSPSASPGALPDFETIGGRWCPATAPHEPCLTVELPYVSVDGDEDSSNIMAVDVTAQSTPCYATSLAGADASSRQSTLFYCPAGFSPAAKVRGADVDLTQDRLYIVRALPDAEIYVRSAGDRKG